MEILALRAHIQIIRAKASVLLMGLLVMLGQQCIRRTFPYVTTFLPHRNTQQLMAWNRLRRGLSEEIKFNRVEKVLFLSLGHSRITLLLFKSWMWKKNTIFKFQIRSDGLDADGQTCKRYHAVYIHPSSRAPSLDMFGKRWTFKHPQYITETSKSISVN